VGDLYKRRLIAISDNGLRLVWSPPYNVLSNFSLTNLKVLFLILCLKVTNKPSF
jgi:hypothetical protein